MDKMEEAAEAFADYDAAFCTLGEPSSLRVLLPL